MSAVFLYKDERIADVLPGCHLHTTSLYEINSFLKDNGFYRMTEYSAKLTVSRPVEGGSGDIMESQYGKGEEIFTEDVDWGGGGMNVRK